MVKEKREEQLESFPLYPFPFSPKVLQWTIFVEYITPYISS